MRRKNWSVDNLLADVLTVLNGITGDITGDVTGDVTGDITGGVVNPESSYVADGAIATTDSFVQLDATDASTAMTIAAPAAGRQLTISCVDATNTVTVTLTAGTYDGTNNVATFDAAAETLVLYGISATRFVIVENIGGVALS